MQSIGVMGVENAGQTMDILSGIFSEWKDNLCKIQFIQTEHSIEVIITNQRTSRVYLLNNDEKNFHHYLPKKPTLLITFGLNPKSCVTISSILDKDIKTILCCIQRPLPTLGGEKLMQQEFTVSVKRPIYTTSSILGAVTAALVCNFPVELFSKILV